MVLIKNHFQRAISLLASQFREKISENELTRFQKLIHVFVQSLQECDDVDQTLQDDRWLDTAYGQQLDGLGEILGISRNPDEGDEDYRERLRFQIFINTSNGTPEDCIQILKFITRANTVRYNEYYPAAYQMSTDGLVFPKPTVDLITAIQSVSPVAVQYVPITATYGVEKPFIFSSDPNFALLGVVPNENNILDIYNVQVDTFDLLEVNTGEVGNPNFGGGFAEAIGMYPNYVIDTEGAGQLAEVIQINGTQAFI